MGDISINIKGYEKALAKIRAYPIKKEKAVNLILERASINIQNNARRLVVARTKRHTNIQNQIQHRKIKNGWEISVKAGYAPYVEFGTGLLVDVPVDARTYAIQFKGAGIKQVNLPARPFMYPSYRLERPKIRRLVKAEIKRT